jgi:hypothetical protein
MSLPLPNRFLQMEQKRCANNMNRDHLQHASVISTTYLEIIIIMRSGLSASSTKKVQVGPEAYYTTNKFEIKRHNPQLLLDLRDRRALLLVIAKQLELVRSPCLYSLTTPSGRMIVTVQLLSYCWMLPDHEHRAQPRS